MMEPLIFLGLLIVVGLTIVAIADIVKYERRMRRVNNTINSLERGRGRHSE
ncbi:hypothetical protein SEA_PHRIEDRICE_29 [Microbacterium phage PhriedRice]|uniref:Uncharacterized protein n=1 Tax=Microbacterium phage PhriedRice TaxID=2652407 RepID=A0A5J6T5A8_9CAUD|nr:hypothetical protein SEA_PHRIEDRICE_29 [Microbacterium phage PhriedRice]